MEKANIVVTLHDVANHFGTLPHDIDSGLSEVFIQYASALLAFRIFLEEEEFQTVHEKAKEMVDSIYDKVMFNG